MPRETELTGQTKRTSQRASDLRGNANRAPVLFGNEHSLGQFAVGETYQISPRAVTRIETAMNAGQLDIPLRRKRCAQRLRQIRHQLKIVEPSLIDRLVDLRRTKCGMKEFG